MSDPAGDFHTEFHITKEETAILHLIRGEAGFYIYGEEQRIIKNESILFDICPAIAPLPILELNNLYNEKE